jgi:CRP-like cAMP-binding protein
MNIDLVPQVPLFDSVGRRHHARLASLADTVDIPSGTVLVREGGLARGFFVVLAGVAEVSVNGAPVATLGPGDFFGEVGLLARTPTTATVRAATPMQLVVMGAREFHTLRANFTGVAQVLEEAMVARAA